MLAEYIQPFTSWLELHPHWAGAIAFLVAFAESLAIIGTIVPGSVALTAVGVLIGIGAAPFTITIVGAILGAFAGDVFSYWIGHTFQGNLRNKWPFKNHPHLLSKGEGFFMRHGGKSIFIGRFVGPIRSILPLIAGMLAMPLWRFLIVDLISSLAWAPSYILPGILIGAASVELSPEIATRFVIILLIALLLLFTVSWLIKFVLAYGIERINRSLDKTWTYLSTHKPSHFITNLLRDPNHPTGHGQLVLAFIWLLSTSLFIVLALCVKYTTLFTPLNMAVFHVLQSVRTIKLDQLMVAFSFIGEIQVLTLLLIVITAWLFLRRNNREACYLLLSGLLGASLTYIFRALIKFPRPSGLMLVKDSFSFPSGHATLSVAILGFLAILISKQMHRDIPKSVVYIPISILIFLIAFSRIFLGDHWLTDIIGGGLLGISCCLFSMIALQRQLSKPIDLLSLSLISLLTLGVGWSYYFFTHFEKEVFNHQPYFPVTTLDYSVWKNQTQAILPLYRNSRLGKPIESLNIQWSDNLSNIENQLSQTGWKKVEVPTLMARFERLLVEDKKQHVPVLDKLYQLQQPSLMMTKSIGSDNPILILRLWPSRISFNHLNTPLWVGSVHYRILWHSELLSNNKSAVTSLPKSLEVLTKDVTTSPHRLIKYSSGNIDSTLMPSTVEILLVYPK